jgi:hypothetical protein
LVGEKVSVIDMQSRNHVGSGIASHVILTLFALGFVGACGSPASAPGEDSDGILNEAAEEIYESVAEFNDEDHEVVDGDTDREDWTIESDNDFEFDGSDDSSDSDMHESLDQLDQTVFFPNQDQCAPPEKNLSRWILEFPRMFASGSYLDMGQREGEEVYLAGLGKITFFHPEEAPTTYFPENFLLTSAVEGPPGVWHAADRYDLWRFREGEPGWHKVVDGSGYEWFPDHIMVDSEGVVWGFSKLHWAWEAFRWDGEEVTWYGLVDEREDARVGQYGEVLECEGRKYFAGSILYHEIDVAMGAIFLANEDTQRFEVLYKSDIYEPRITSFVSSSMNPETCEFIAAGFWHYVRGFLKDPLEITGVSEDPLPSWVWMDWGSDTAWGLQYQKHYDEVAPDDPRIQPGIFFKSERGENFTVMPPQQLEEGFSDWFVRSIKGTSENNIYAIGDILNYKYDKDSGQWGLIWEQELLREPGYIGHAYARSLAVRALPDGRFRVHTTGFRLPVMRRTDCHDWEEAFPDSEEALALYDDGEFVWVVGGWPDVVYGIGDKWNELKGPEPPWVEARSIYKMPENGVYVVAWYDASGADARLLVAVPGVIHEKEERDENSWDWMQVFLDPIWRPYRVVGTDEGHVYLLCRRSKSSSIPTLPDRDRADRIYRIDGVLPTFVAEFEGSGFLNAHGNRIFYGNASGVHEIEPSTGVIEHIVPAPVWHNTEYDVNDAVELEDGTWVLATKSGPSLVEYDPQTSEQRYYFPKMGSAGLIDLEVPWENWRKLDTSGYIYHLELLPTGEVIGVGKAGQIVIRFSDEAWSE